MASVVSKDGLYSVADYERVRLGCKEFKHLGKPAMVRARWTGEHRSPQAGEWFLSGNPVEAHYAPSYIFAEQYIAELVQGRVVYDS